MFPRLRNLLGTVSIFLGIFAVLMIAMNWPATSAHLGYAILQHSSPVRQESAVSPTPQPDGIYITGITSAPIQWNIPVEDVIDSLNHGVAHLAETALPGQSGNLVLIGHSSDYSWKRNPYASTFTLLPELKAGDILSIWKDKTLYNYSVTSTEVVAPEKVSVLNQHAASEATLITCYPIGTTWRRFIVHASYTKSAPLSQGATSSGDLPVIDVR